MAGTTTYDPKVNDPIESLYDVVHDKGLYTKSLEDFKQQYSTPDAIGKLYQVVRDQGLYSKTQDQFTQKYFGRPAIPHLDYRTPMDQKSVSESTNIPQPVTPQIKAGTVADQWQAERDKATQKINAELNSNHEVVADQVQKLKQQNTAAQNLTNYAQQPRSDQPLTSTHQLANSLQPAYQPPAPASPDEINAYQNTLLTNPDAARGFLGHVVQAHPEKNKDIQSAMYVMDAANRVDQDPSKMGKVLQNTQKIKSGDLHYNVQGGQLLKPEDTWQSIGTGLKNKEQAFADYDLFNNSTPDQAIAELEKRRAQYDPDQPAPIPSNFLANMTGGMASQPLRGLIAGKVAGGVTAMIPGAEEFAPAVDKFVAAAQSGDDYRKMSYANYLQQHYNELRNEGKSPEFSYAEAQDIARKQSMVDAVAGAAMMGAGEGIARIKLPSFSLSEGFAKAVVNGLKQGAKGIGEAGAVGLIQGAGQDLKNKIAQQSGLQTDASGQDIGQAIKDGALFTLGMAAIAKGGDLLSNKTRIQLLQGLSKAPQEQVNAELGHQMMEGNVTPQEAQKAASDVEQHRLLNASIPDNITEESKTKIFDKIKRRDYLEMQLESADKAFHPEIKDKIKAINDDIIELSKDKTSKGQVDVLNSEPSEQTNVSNASIPESANKILPGDEVISPHFEGTRTVRSVSDDGQSVFVEGEQDHHVHEIPIGEVNKSSAETEKPVSQNIQPDDNFRTLDYGENKGKEEDKASQDQIKQEIVNNDPIGKSGEKFSEFINRVIPAFARLLNEGEHNTVLVTHSSVIKALKVWEEMGRPLDRKSILKEFAQKYVDLKPEKEGDVTTFKGDNGNEIKVVRHGETEDNVASEFREDNTKLTDKGVRQAEKAGNALKKDIGASPKIVTSDLPRAVHTSNIIHHILNSKTQENAKAIRGHQGELPEGGQAVAGGEETGGNDIQPPAEQAPVNGETAQQTGEKVAAGEEGEGRLVGPSHAALRQLADKLGLEQPQRGEMYTPKEYADRGRALINAGADPHKVAEQFKKDGQVSPDAISVARAHLEDLAKAAFDAGDKHGLDSPEYKSAKAEVQKWQDEVVKPMGNIAGQSMTSLQGQRDIDHGSFTSLVEAAEAEKEAPLTEREKEMAQQHAEEVKKLQDKNAELQEKIDKGFGQKEGPQDKKFATTAKKAADAFRKLKTKEFTFKDDKGNDVPIIKMGLSWNEVVELGAKAIEKTGQIADGIAAIIDKVKEADWYKGLTAPEKDRFEKELTDHYAEIADKKTADRVKALEKQLSDLQAGIIKDKKPTRELTQQEKGLKEQIYEAKKNLGLLKPKATKNSNISEADASEKAMSDEEKNAKAKDDLIKRLDGKKDNKFSPEDAKDVWNYMRDTYLRKNGGLYEDALYNTAKDLGISPEQVRNAIITPKGNRVVSDEMYNTMYKERMAQRKAENWVKGMGKSGTAKFFNGVPAFFFGLKVFGHGTVGMVTHAGINIFRPSAWKTYWPNFIRQFKFFFGSASGYEKFMQDFVRDPDFTFWKRAGLACDPNEAYEEYQATKNFFGRMGERSERGFNVLKVYRLEQAKEIYSHLSETEKADPETAKEIAKIVNHSTGTSEVNFGKMSGAMNVAFFAPKMEVARWQRLIQQPIKAADTYINWKNASPADKVAAKLVAKRSGEVIATWMVSLAANQALLSLSGSKNNINFTDPTQSDWLKFKAGDRNIDFTGGMQSTVKFIGAILNQTYIAWAGSDQKQRETPKDKIESAVVQYFRGKSSPLAGTAWEVATGADAMRRPLPFSSVKPKKGDEAYGFWEYLFSGQGPIPLSEALKDIHESMKAKGMDEPDIESILWGIGTGAISGGTGARVSQAKEQPGGGSGGGSGAGDNYQITEWH